METTKPLFELVAIDCPDTLALAGFYAQVLGWTVHPESDDEWATILPPGELVGLDRPLGRPAIAFQRVASYVAPTWPTGEHPQQMHLDFIVADLDAAEPDVLAAGARVAELQTSQTGSYRVYLDPVGHPFCLVRAS